MGHRRQFSAFVTKDSNPASAIRHALQFTRAFLADYSFDPRLKVKLAILVEELVTNALRHAGKAQDLSLALYLEEIDKTVRLSIEDDGAQFNPLTVPPITKPDPKTGGGIGLAIVQAWAEDAVYAHEQGRNRLELTLR